MDTAFVIPIEPKVYAGLQQESREEKRDTVEIVNDVLRKHLLLWQMKRLQETIEPQARAQGLLTDDDVFREVS